MAASVSLLMVPGSPAGDALRSRIGARGLDCHVLNLDAPLLRKPVTIGARQLVWEGVNLLSVGAILVEMPVFPWPQPTRLEGLTGPPDHQARAMEAEREARSLIVSAIRVAAESLPVVNPPGACHLAAAPATALDMAERAGVAVGAWRLGPVPNGETTELILDSVGRDRWHTPARPARGEPALAILAPAGPVTTVLVIGRRLVAGVRYESAHAWAAHRASRERPEMVAAPAIVEIALRAAEACDLPLAEITVGSSPTFHTVFIDAAPDLAAWGLRTGGLAFDALADYLVHLAAQPSGASR